MKRFFLKNLVAIVTIFAVNGVILCIGKSVTASDVGFFGAGSLVASLVALRMWSRTDMLLRSSAWWLLVALASALVGALLFWLDILFGFIVLPIGAEGGMMGAISNPFAVMISAAFLPFFTSIAIGSAIRTALKE